MILTLLRNFTLILAFQGLLACGSNKDSGTSNPLSLPGGWAFTCLEISTDNKTENQSRRFDFTSTTYSEQVSVYGAADSSCRTVNESRKISGTYTEGTQSDEKTPIDFVLTSVLMTVNDETTLSYLNATAGSGNSDPICGGGWSKGKEKTLTEKNCEANTQNLPYAGLKLFDTYKISDSSLFFGQSTGLPTSAESRPSNIDETLSFARQ